jgi:uridine kinase
MIPNYNYKTCKRDGEGVRVKAKPLVIFEGIFALLDQDITDILDFNIFVHCDDDIRLIRRL